MEFEARQQADLDENIRKLNNYALRKMNVREKISIENKLKGLKKRTGEFSNRLAKTLEQQLQTNRELHPEPAPNSMIGDMKQSLGGHKRAKIPKNVIKNARGEQIQI